MQAQTLYDFPALYDRLMPPGPCEAFYGGLAAPGSSVLDLACGTGRLSVPLARGGRSVTGLDVSPAMLAAAERKAAAAGVAVDWVQGDMADFDLGRRFDLVMISCNSLGHLLTDEALVSAFRAVRRHLAPGGVFAFDVVNPDAKGLLRPVKERIKRAPAASGVRLRETVDYDPERRIRGARWRVLDGDGSERTIRLELRQLFPDAWPPLLTVARLQLTNRFGDFDRAPFTARSKLQVCLAAAA
jgi:SAM-dependent methyltransferase